MDFLTYFPGLTTIQIMAAPVLLIWLAVETYFDFKDQNIPVVFSIVPLVSGLLFLFFGVDKVLAVFILFLVAVSNLKASVRLPFTVVLWAAAYFMVHGSSMPVLIGYLIFFTFFQIGIMGGADALAATYLLCWFPSWGMLFVIVALLLVFSLTVLITKHKFTFLSAIKNTISGKEGTRSPAMIAFSSSLAVFLIINMIIFH